MLPPVLDVASSGRSLPPRRLVAHKGLMAKPHGIAGAEIHDDEDGDMGKYEEAFRVRTTVELLHYMHLTVGIQKP